MISVAQIIPGPCPLSSLPQLCNTLRLFGFANIFVINDGLPRSFDTIFETLKHNGNVVVSSIVYQGKGGAMKLGLNEILEFYPDFSHYVFCDDDDQHGPADASAIASESILNEYAFSIGTRTFDSGNPWKSLLRNRFMTFFLRVRNQIIAADSQSGLRCFSRNSVNQLLAIPDNGFGFELQTIVHFKRLGIQFQPIPVKTIYFSKNRHTRFTPMSDSYKVVKSALGLKP